MIEEVYNLVKRLSDPKIGELDIITWGAPVPSFGNLATSKIATLGLNPSDKEYVDNSGKELSYGERRFHTLTSLGINNWSDANETHFKSIVELCNEYFSRNPYDNWFKRLDYLISGTSFSYYFPSSGACHLDLIPFATNTKWAKLSSDQKTKLLKEHGDLLGMLLKNSSVKLLILNGKTVIESLKRISDVTYDLTHMVDWTLPRKGTEGIFGYAYQGVINCVGGVILEDKVHVLGFNHNIQSSFGVTTQVQTSIRNWITKTAESLL
jgi:hypothetical protein